MSDYAGGGIYHGGFINLQQFGAFPPQLPAIGFAFRSGAGISITAVNQHGFDGIGLFEISARDMYRRRGRQALREDPGTNGRLISDNKPHITTSFR